MIPHVDRVFHMEDGVLSEHAHTSALNGALLPDRPATLRFAPGDR
jgi:hypothetical protein